MEQCEYGSRRELWFELRASHQRALNQASDDLVLPVSGLVGWDPLESRRHLAVAHVVCTLPERDYARLVDLADCFVWFLPAYRTYGAVESFTVTVDPGQNSTERPYTRVLYLSPRLDRAAWDIVVSTVAHELAHIVLEHPRFAGEEYDSYEEAAWQLVCGWGFGREAKKHRALNKRRATQRRSRPNDADGDRRG